MESLNGFELPALAWHTPLLGELRQLAAEIISITNDLVSAEKEEAAGDTDNNLLLILERQEGCTRLEAIERLRQMTHERFERFLRLEQRVPDLDDVLDSAGRLALRRYIYGLHDLVAGDNEWEHTSGRYRVKRATPSKEASLGAAPPRRKWSSCSAAAGAARGAHRRRRSLSEPLRGQPAPPGGQRLRGVRARVSGYGNLRGVTAPGRPAALPRDQRGLLRRQVPG